MKTDAVQPRGKIARIRETLLRIVDPQLAYFFVNFEDKSIEFTEHVRSFFDTDTLVFNHYKQALRLLSADDAHKIKVFFKQIIQGKPPQEPVDFFVHSNRHMPRWLRCTGVLFKEDKKNFSFLVGILEDTTDETHRRHILNTCLDVAYIGNLSTDTIFIDGKTLSQLGFQQGFSSDMSSIFRDRIATDDLALYDSYFSHFFTNFSGEKSIRTRTEYRLRDNEETPLWFSSRNRVYYDDENKPNLIVGGLVGIEKMERYNQFVQDTVDLCEVTGLPNRARFFKDIELRSPLFGTKGFIAIIHTNTERVHSTLDIHLAKLFLKELATVFQQNASDGTTLYRMETNTFALVMPEHTAEDILKQMERYKEVGEIPFMARGAHCSFRLSMVGLPYQTLQLDPGELFQKGSVAIKTLLFEQKKSIALVDDTLFQKNEKNALLENQLRQSVADNMQGFFLVYQPFIRVSDKNIIGAEALLRWKDEKGDIISPGDFIPILENSELMDDVGEWVFKTASNQCKKWVTEHFAPNFYMGINATAAQLSKKKFLNITLEHLKKIKLSPLNTVIELTESIPLADFQSAVEVFSDFKRNGLGLAIDDFGTGYSSLSYLKNLPSDKIKIDRSFIENIEHDDYAREFVQSIVNITRSVGKTVCVEGIETDDQAKILTAMGADVFQGYLFGKPQSPEDFKAFYLEHLNRKKGERKYETGGDIDAR